MTLEVKIVHIFLGIFSNLFWSSILGDEFRIDLKFFDQVGLGEVIEVRALLASDHRVEGQLLSYVEGQVIAYLDQPQCHQYDED